MAIGKDDTAAAVSTTTSAGAGGTSLRQQMLLECETMARYALATGHKIPPDVMVYLDAALAAVEAEAAIESGRAESPVDMATLTEVHAALVEVIKPATPAGVILLMAGMEKRPMWRLLGTVPILHQLIAVSLISLLVFIGTSLSPEVNGRPGQFDLLRNSGLSLLLNELFLLSAATMGAAFAALRSVIEIIKTGAFDSRQESMYWIQILLGMIAGLLLATVVPIEQYLEATHEDGSASLQLHGFGQPLLALLGGFSASVVYVVLERLGVAVTSLFRSDPGAEATAAAEALKAQLHSQNLRRQALVSAAIDEIESHIEQNATPEEIKQLLGRVRRELSPMSAMTKASASRATP